MSEVSINQQVEIIKQVTESILQSKEATRQFLLNAGIIKGTAKPASQTNAN